MSINRPQWADNTPLMQEYYDQYWGFPVHNDRFLFEMLCLELFQAGLSWQTIWRRRLAFEDAFAEFDVDRVAGFTPADVDRLCQDEGIIRNRHKILAVINNAKVVQQMQKKGQSFNDYIWHFVGGQPQHLKLTPGQSLPAQTPLSRSMAKQMKKDGFSFVGPTIVYSFMTAVGLVNARLS